MPGLVVASNRGPVSFRTVDGRSVGTRGVGGLVTAVTGALRNEEAIWIAVALDEGDRERARLADPIRDGGVLVDLIELDEATLEAYYNQASNRGIWFAAHGTGALEIPDDAWRAYRAVNARIAERIVERAAMGAAVLVHDFHFCLVPAFVRRLRPDLAVSFFWHVPFPEPDTWWSLGEVAVELLNGIAAADVVGVHAARWADAMARSMQRAGGPARIQILPLGIDQEALARSASANAVHDRLAGLARFDGRQLIVRSDRIEPAKAIGDGLAAFEQLLEQHPEHRGEVTHLIRLTVSRGHIAEYQQERERLEASVRRINERFGTTSWTPVEFLIEDDLAGSLAAFRRYDVLLITSHADGMNLVAREGPFLNQRSGVLVLSRGAGAADSFADGGALLFDPGDIPAITAALHTALTMTPEQRADIAKEARMRAPGATPAAWLDAQRLLAMRARDARVEGVR